MLLLLLFWWSPTPGFQRLPTALLLIVLSVVGLEFLRQQAIRDFPDATLEGASERMGEVGPRPPQGTVLNDRAGRFGPARMCSSLVMPIAALDAARVRSRADVQRLEQPRYEEQPATPITA